MLNNRGSSLGNRRPANLNQANLRLDNQDSRNRANHRRGLSQDSQKQVSPDNHNLASRGNPKRDNLSRASPGSRGNLNLGNQTARLAQASLELNPVNLVKVNRLNQLWLVLRNSSVRLRPRCDERRIRMVNNPAREIPISSPVNPMANPVAHRMARHRVKSRASRVSKASLVVPQGEAWGPSRT